MRLVKLALISVVVLFMLITAISLLLPSTIFISRAIDIEQPADSVYKLVNNIDTWPNWMENFDSATVSGNPSGAGATISGNNVIVRIKKASQQKIEAIWQSGNNRELPGEFNFVPANSQPVTTVHWQFTQKVKWYPWEKFASIVSDKALGPYMEKSLDNLKAFAEGKN